jgi:peptide/nickel transport system permease protein
MELGALSLFIGTFIGIPVGVLAAVNQGGIFDQVTRIMAVIVSAVPVFWLGLILLLVFGSWLELLPMGNRRPASISGDYTLAEIIPHYILPVFTLSSFTIATFSRFTRASVLDVLNQDYVRTARAKGLQNTNVWFTHATRNALIPIATLIGPALPGIIAGAVLTETIYAWPGMGRLVLEAIQSQDYPVVMAVTLMFSLATIFGYLISDLLYAVLDPRIRLN